jgi:hypothetical protein
VDTFENEFKSLWCMVQDNAKDACNKISNVEDRVDHIELSKTETVSKIQQLEHENVTTWNVVASVGRPMRSLRNRSFIEGVYDKLP